MKKLLILVAMFAQFSNAESYTCDNVKHGMLKHVEDMEVVIDATTHQMKLYSDGSTHPFTATKISNNHWRLDESSDVLVTADSYGVYSISKHGKTWLTCYETDFD